MVRYYQPDWTVIRHFNNLTFNYQITEMDSWRNIIISKNDPEIIEINKLENELEVVSTSVRAVRQLITKFEICHFKFAIHYDYILRSIEFLSPFVDPDSIGSSHPRKGPDSWKKNKTGRSRTAHIYIDALQLWLNPKSLTGIDSHTRVIQLMEAHITELWLSSKYNSNYLYICQMKSSQEIKELFAQLPISSQRQLLDELLQEQELQGKILTDAQEEISGKRKKKPCPHCTSKNVYKRGKQKGANRKGSRCTNAMIAKDGIVKQQGRLYTISSLNQNGNLIYVAWRMACQ